MKRFSDNEIYNDESFLIWKKKWEDRLENKIKVIVRKIIKSI